MKLKDFYKNSCHDQREKIVKRDGEEERMFALDKENNKERYFLKGKPSSC